jgi:CRISPR-associated protein Cmr1
MRKQPSLPPEPKRQQPEGMITQVREYKLITPLFGGGVRTGEVDPVTVIRGTEIRGQLRFWWRACRGGAYQTLGAMKQAEDEIWGTASKKKQISNTKQQNNQSERGVQIIVTQKSENGKSIVYSPNLTPPYASFPLQENRRENKPPGSVRKDVSFTLTISFPGKQKADIEAALWAWETFGGIGARTRRGFGALRCISITEQGVPGKVNPPEANEAQAKQWLRDNLDCYVADGSWPDNVPHLNRQLIVGEDFKLIIYNGNSDEKAQDIWYDLMDALKSFRQARPNYNTRHPGRSMWSEPSAIRHYTGQSLPSHNAPIPNPLVKKFPRAAFGLPIIFQFKDRNTYRLDDPNADPRKTVLQLATYERFASPLILKPLACQGGDVVGLAIILRGTSLGKQQLVLKTQEGTQQQWNVTASLSPGETLELTPENRKIRLNSATDVLQAFIKFL